MAASNEARAHRIVSLVVATACGAAMACRTQEQRPQPAPVEAGRAAAAGAALGADAAALPRVEETTEPPDAGQAVSAEGWVETQSYKVKLDEIVRCAEGGDAGARPRIGVSVRVTSRHELFVASRDFALKRGGILVDPERFDVKVTAKCSPLLPQKEIQPGQVARGFVVFDLPPSFQAGRGEIALVYHPTRWGGAPRVSIPVPACLDACPPAAAASRPSRKAR